MNKVNIISNVMLVSCAHWYNPTRKAHHVCGILLKNPQPQYNHEKTSENPNWEIFYKIPNHYLQKFGQVQKRLRNCYKLEETKEINKCNMVSRVGTEIGHQWRQTWGNSNKVCSMWMLISYFDKCTMFM